MRQLERAFVVEGQRAVSDALASGANPIALVVREGDDGTHQASDVDPRVVEPGLFATLCETVHPQGILGVFPFPDLTLALGTTDLFVVADQISDPGNLGTLVRSAAAAGATGVFLTPGTVDPFNPKVVRAAMGAHFRVPIMDLTPDSTKLILERTKLRVLADLGPFRAPEEIDWQRPAAIIVASETSGPSETGRRLATETVTIPMAHGMESLNAAVAGAVILFEAARQRRSQVN